MAEKDNSKSVMEEIFDKKHGPLKSIEKYLEDNRCFRQGHFLIPRGYHASERFVGNSHCAEISGYIQRAMADAVPEDILKKINAVLYTSNALCLCTFPSLLSRKTGKDIGYAMAEIKDSYTAIKTQGELHNEDNVLIASDNILTGNEAIALVNLAIGNNGRLSERANPIAICCLVDSRENKSAVYYGAQVFSVIQRSPKIYLAEYCKMCEKKVPLNHFL